MMKVSRFFAGLRDAALAAVHQRNVPLPGNKALVSFTFDDVPRSACNVGAAILKKYKVHGTFYLATALMGEKRLGDDELTLDDIHNLVTEGHELGSHTLNHVSCRNLPLEKFRQDALAGQVAVSELRGGLSKGSFSYPFGHVTRAAKKSLSTEFASCRGIQAGINAPFADLNLLRANRLYSSSVDLAAVHTLVQQNQKSNGWLIFYTHDVRSDYSKFGCTPELLDAAVECSLHVGAHVLSIEECLRVIA
jgi:peptidoglycan/xylan/chitin deacetylase (PgdA/CDA1 family)